MVADSDANSDNEYTSSDDERTNGNDKLDIGLPGCGLPLDYDADVMFKNAFNLIDYAEADHAKFPPIALRELTMLRLMDQISDEPHWDKKVFDRATTRKWEAEALKAAETGVDITQKMIDWCIGELRHKVGIFRTTQAISVYTGDVVKSDTIVPKALRDSLKAAVASLEDMKDWRPGSDGKILDLVHPSLYPLVYGRTRILTKGLTTLNDFIDQCGNGRVLGAPDDETCFYASNEFSYKFQWLPCEVDVSQEHARITSYINNLNPQKHRDLYQVIERVITHAIPMWNMTLTPLKNEKYYYTRLTYEYSPDPATVRENKESRSIWDESVDEVDYDCLDWRDWMRESRCRVGSATQPEPGLFQPPFVPQYMRKMKRGRKAIRLRPEYTVDLRRDFQQKGLQVIVKLTNIHLTPDKPEYEGGTWHIEGRLNEHICATALYYYDSVNITENYTTFRQQCACPEFGYSMDEQGERDLLNNIFGIDLGEPAVQEIGSIETREGRLITFPNVFQHQVQPFGLADPSKPGHRKVLALFLVDPNIRIISTANVPCQRRDWWHEKVMQCGPRRLVNLPLELQDLVFKQVDNFPIGIEEARKLRLELMEEHHTYADTHSEAFASNRFSLNYEWY